MKTLIMFMLCAAFLAQAQVSITATERLPIPPSERWTSPQFAPDGRSVFLTSVGYNGIWQYHPDRSLLKEITREQGAGFGFSISMDGTKLAYRSTEHAADPRNRVQRAVEVSVSNGNQQVWFSGNSIKIPRYRGNTIVIPDITTSEPSSPVAGSQHPVIIGVDNDKILLSRNEALTSIDPLHGGQYIWPVLSPDRTKLAAVDMEKGAFICDLDGTNIILLGKCNAPQWTRDGRWIIGMDDTDDGHHLTGSEIIAVSADGQQRVRLTDTREVHEMFPAVSPVENTIIVTTADGSLLRFTYTEGN